MNRTDRLNQKIKALESDLAILTLKKALVNKRIDSVDDTLLTVKRNVGQRISSLRQQKKMNKSELSELSGVSRMSLVRIESGQQLPGLDTLLRLSILLDCKLSDLIADSDFSEAEVVSKQ